MLSTTDIPDIELCKIVAGLEGLTEKQFERHEKIVNGAGICTGFNHYNPAKPSALLCALMFKHSVEIDYEESLVSIYEVVGGYAPAVVSVQVKFSSKELLPRAILFCIIKANLQYSVAH